MRHRSNWALTVLATCHACPRDLLGAAQAEVIAATVHEPAWPRVQGWAAPARGALDLRL